MAMYCMKFAWPGSLLLNRVEQEAKNNSGSGSR